MTFTAKLAQRRNDLNVKMQAAKNMLPVLNMAKEMLPNDKLTEFTSILLDMEIRQMQERLDLMDDYISSLMAEEIAIDNGTYLRGQ